jgi:MATE family multidrug resistance protein
MASLETPRAAGTPVPVDPGLWRAELRRTVRLALPMALTQLGQIVMMTTDLVLIGRLGDEALAAAALAHTVLFAAFTLGMGVVAAVAPLAAQAFGARRPRMVRRALRVGLWATAILGVPMTLLQFRGEDILVALGQNPHSAALAGRYLAGMAWAIIPAWAFIACRNFMGAVNRPEPALWITLAAIPANAALAYLLIYGGFGVPGLDLFGAGLATALIDAGMCVAAIAIACTRRPFKKYRVLGRLWRPDWRLLAKLVAVGLADLWGAAVGIRALCRGRIADGPHLHERRRRPPDRAPGRGPPVHGAFWDRACRHCAGGPSRRTPRSHWHTPRWFRRHRRRGQLHGRHDADRRGDPARNP